MDLLILIVLWPPDVLVEHRCLWAGFLPQDGLCVQPVFEDGLHAFIGDGLQGQGAVTRGFQSVRGVFLRQPYDPETGAIALFRMGFACHHLRHQCPGLRSVCSCPAENPGWRPGQILLMRLGSMFRSRGVPVFLVAARVAGHAPVVDQELHGGRGQPDIAPLADPLVGDAVIMVVHRDMVIDIHGGFFPLRVFIRPCWEGA